MLAEQREKQQITKVLTICIKMKQSLLKELEKTKAFESFYMPPVSNHRALSCGTQQTLLTLKSMMFENLEVWVNRE